MSRTNQQTARNNSNTATNGNISNYNNGSSHINANTSSKVKTNDLNLKDLFNICGIKKRQKIEKTGEYSNFRKICRRCLYLTSERTQDLIYVLYIQYIMNAPMTLYRWTDAFSRWKWSNMKYMHTMKLEKFFLKCGNKTFQTAIDQFLFRDIGCLEKPQVNHTKINDSMEELCGYYMTISNVIRELLDDREFVRFLNLQIDLCVIPMNERQSTDNDSVINTKPKKKKWFSNPFSRKKNKFDKNNVCKDFKYTDLYQKLAEMNSNSQNDERKSPMEYITIENNRTYIKELKRKIKHVLTSMRLPENINGRIVIVIDRRLYDKNGNQIDCSTMEFNKKYWNDVVYIVSPPEEYRYLNKNIQPRIDGFPATIDVGQFNKIYFDNIKQWILPKHTEMEHSTKDCIGAFTKDCSLFTMHFQIESKNCVRTYFVCQGGMLRFFKCDINKVLPLFFVKSAVKNVNKLKRILNEIKSIYGGMPDEVIAIIAEFTEILYHYQYISQNILNTYNDLNDSEFNTFMKKIKLLKTIQ